MLDILEERGDHAAPGDQRLEVLNPTAQSFGGDNDSLAPRPRSLDGLTLGLLWNGKPNGDVALKFVGEELAKRFAALEVRFFTGSIRFEKQLLEQAIAQCDIVVTSNADCGACTSWLIHDSILMERAGVPAVTIASRGFEIDCEATAAAFGLPGMRYVVVPRVYQALTEAQAVDQTRPAIDDIVALLTSQDDVRDEPALKIVTQATLSFGGTDLLDAAEHFNDHYLTHEWGDGYPLLPPTPERVAALLAGVRAARDDIVCYLNPGMGCATVEKVAVNCAMAGCSAAEMEVVMAAIRAIARVPPPLDKSVLMSTGAFAPLLLINGPATASLDINDARCCLGPGNRNRVNIRIGRAVTLCLKNLGRWIPGVMDMDSIGTARKFTMCFAENTAESPWEPYHVSQGCRPDDSTVSVFHTTGEWDYDIHGFRDANHLLKKIAIKVPHQPQVGYWTRILGHLRGDEDQRVILLPPDHARQIADAGLSKADAERILHQQIRISVEELVETSVMNRDRIRPEYQYLFEMTAAQRREQGSVPALLNADCVRIVVAGSHTPKALAYGVMTAPVTERITATADGK